MRESPEAFSACLIRLQHHIVAGLRLADEQGLHEIAASLDRARYQLIGEMQREDLENHVIDVPPPDALS